MEAVYAKLTTRAKALYEANLLINTSRSARVLIALAGPPGSGKSTVAAAVVDRLNAASECGPYATVLPMDGFHLTRAELDTMPNKVEAYARRGAAWTFDARGVVDLVAALHESRTNFAKVHRAPAFDHAIKDPVENAIKIDRRIQLVIIEGNWLLYNEDPWSAISQLVDDTWFIEVDEEVALQRVACRHIKSGVETRWEDALYRARTNDMLNGNEICTKLIRPALCVRSVEETDDKS
jgi:pantothenate kinase